jgi:hypothetical protein
MPSDERIKEINEAYQVLKHSSTRVEYDLNRTYGQKKRKSYFKRLSVPVSILIMLIMIGLIYIRNYQFPPPSGLTVSNQKDQTDQKDQITQPTQRPIDIPAQQPRVAAVTPAIPFKPNQTNQIDQINQTDQRNQIDQRSPITPSIAMAETMEKVQLPPPPQNPITPLPNDVITNRPAVAINQTDQRDHRDRIEQMDVKIELVQFKPPPLLATEDEVRSFFNHYIEYYTRKDIESFLSLFSSKATQNQKDGLEGIRRIYTDFFDQGQEVRYSLQDMKIEIYQNAVEVKARYEIGQMVIKSGERKLWRGWIRWVLIKEAGALKILSIDYQYEKPTLGKREEPDATS